MANQQKKRDLSIDSAAANEAALVFWAINHKVRQKILQVIHQGERVYVGEIYKKLKIEQSVTSMHLAALRAQNLDTT